MSKRILIVDDDGPMRSFLCTVLGEEGYRLEEARNGTEGLAMLTASDFDLVITDLRMPGLSGLDLLREGRKARPEARWIVITAHGSIGNAVEAMRSGASDYLTKPLRDPDELRHVIRRVLREADAEARIHLLSEELGRQFPPEETIFLGGRMAQVRKLVQGVAPTDTTVLITGQSGTGKELIARMVHNLSSRREGSFIPVHCAALAENLLESELFGHERGAFTGAVSSRKGRFELADGGTIFLDEVGEITPAVQVKLLRVLQEREFERVGGTKPISVDVRIIAATNRDLREEVAAGRYREDFYYRLNVFPIALPTLAERREAILPLAEYFLKKFVVASGKTIDRFTAEARTAMENYHWPGNVRELQNVIERAVILAQGEIDVRHLNLEQRGAPVAPDASILKVNERETIGRILAEVGGSRKRAAQILGISLRTLQYRIKEFGL
ncbi:MAG: sigma-54-dependent transcriptional regulator [Actinomycetota bacterium]